MVDGNRNEPLLERWLRSLKNHPLIAAVLLFVAVVTGIATFTESVDKLLKHYRAEPNKAGHDRKTQQDVRFEEAVIGTWKASSKLPAPSGFVVIDFRYTFLKNGVVNWRGAYSFQGQEFPIMMSGTWSIQDGDFRYEVKSSNVPLAVKEGFASVTRIIQVTKTEITYVDPADGQTKVDRRLD
jgi:hypothetical protein